MRNDYLTSLTPNSPRAPNANRATPVKKKNSIVPRSESERPLLLISASSGAKAISKTPISRSISKNREKSRHPLFGFRLNQLSTGANVPTPSRPARTNPLY